MLRAAERRELLARALATVDAPAGDSLLSQNDDATAASTTSVPLRARYTAEQFLLTAEDFMPVGSESEPEFEEEEEEEAATISVKKEVGEEGDSNRDSDDKSILITHVIPADEAKRRRCHFIDLT